MRETSQPLIDTVALAHEIAKVAVRQTAYAPRWVSLKQASAMLGGVDKKTLRKWARAGRIKMRQPSGYHGKVMCPSHPLKNSMPTPGRAGAKEANMRKESKPKDHSAVMVIRDHKCGADVKAARISIITDEGHLAGVTISRAALESLQTSIGRLLREMDEEES